MELINATKMVAGYTMGMAPSGREQLVVVIKGTFRLPQAQELVHLHDVQLPLLMADTFHGEAGFSAPRYEGDFAAHKRMCDVLLEGSAHAPAGMEVTRQRVVLRVGTMVKQFDVVGDRVWHDGLVDIGISAPRPFTRMPISYGVAFGGVERNEDSTECKVYAPNPVGRGWRSSLKGGRLDGQPLPNTEEPGLQVVSPVGVYRPMAFGPIGRNWKARARFAGTYDDRWLAESFPFLPSDFDDRYYQAAPPDQQIAVPDAPLEVALSGLTPDGERRFTLPHFEAPVHFFLRNEEREDHAARLDTIVFEPDEGRFTMCWRASQPLRRSIHEVAQVLVGKRGRAWWQQRDRPDFPIPVVMVPMEP